MSEIRVRVLTGPTAVGKSLWALRLAREADWEICCMDSMQIYRLLDIGTAKPSPEERALVPHHLLDILDPRDSFSVAQYREIAEQTILACAARDKEVLFVGGTGLYLQALLHPMALGAIPADPDLRAALNAQAETAEGRRALWEKLRTLDPVTASRLPPQDLRRIIRAIEVTEKTGIPFSAQPASSASSPFSWAVAALNLPRPILYDRINRRVSGMMDAGLKEEVAALLAEGVPEDAQSMSAIGYRQMVPCVKGLCSPEQAAAEIALATRHYAKRQLTFLRREPTVSWIDASSSHVETELRKALNHFESFES